MSTLDTIGIIGEMLAWVGAIIGVPVLAAGLTIRTVGGPRLPTNVTIVDDLDQQPIAIWSVKDRTYTRPVTAHDDLHVEDSTSVIGFVPERDPRRLDFHRRSHAERLCRTLAITMLSTSTVGFLVSLLPMFW